MSDESHALSRVRAMPPAEDDINYDAIHAAVLETARGRWFLQEYAKRNRNADTTLVLAAIERMETLIRAGASPQAAGLQGFRSELLDMARAIARTRSEIPDLRRVGPDVAPAATPPAAELAPDIFAAAKRIQDVASTLRGRGVELATCDQIAALASSILGASSLRHASDSRAQKLNDVLQHLERRIHAMLRESGGGADAPADAMPLAEPVEGDFDRQMAAEQKEAIESGTAELAAAETAAPEIIAPEPQVEAVPAQPPVLELEPLPVTPTETGVPVIAEPAELELPPIPVSAGASAVDGSVAAEPTMHIEWGSSPSPGELVPVTAAEIPSFAPGESSSEVAPTADMPIGEDESAGEIESEMLAMARAAMPPPQPALSNGAADAPQPDQPEASAALRKSPSDRLAAIRSMSENERIALFS
jgi:hypothetical protein